MTRATIVHVCSDPRGVPSCGSPTVTTTATAAASNSAQTACRPVILRWFARALISRANSNDVTNSACTNTTEPKPSAAA